MAGRSGPPAADCVSSSAEQKQPQHIRVYHKVVCRPAAALLSARLCDCCTVHQSTVVLLLGVMGHMYVLSCMAEHVASCASHASSCRACGLTSLPSVGCVDFSADNRRAEGCWRSCSHMGAVVHSVLHGCGRAACRMVRGSHGTHGTMHGTMQPGQTGCHGLVTP